MNMTQASTAAAGTMPPSMAAEPQQYLTFMLGGETFALGILAIKEIIEYQSLTELPRMPPCLRGVINLRGAVVPVVDLLALFQRPPSPIGKRSCIVIVELEFDHQRQVVGVMVDAVNEVLDIARSDIEPPPMFGGRFRSDFVMGIGKVKGKFVILLDMENAVFLDALGELGDAVPMTAGAGFEEAVA